MGKPTGFMDYKRQELALRPPQERIKDWEEIKTSSLPHKEELQKIWDTQEFIKISPLE